MMRKAAILLVLFSSSALSIFAQKVTGIVISNEGETLIGATVSVLNSNAGTITDFDGSFTITALDGAILRVSYTGYNSKDVTVNGTTPLEIILEEGINCSQRG